ncbi:MAG: PhnD/SsuA/transferrin family substrate-binding protein [Deltaproteobacteria bacterium]|nr:PhnD/SsuA/transferrin family substrate-binding protein [Deltaproteobacteria bacterium]
MKKTMWILGVFSITVCFCILSSSKSHAGFRICLMQEQKGAAAKFRPLLDYLTNKGVKASFVAAKTYPRAARMFAEEKVDGMFSGSGIAGCMIIKGLAYPMVRPVSNGGWSTYWAVVLAPKGSARFTQNAEYFHNKRVIFCGLASSGEFFFRAVKGDKPINAETLKASSHGAAIDALGRGAADVAIVKNRVWDGLKGKFRGIDRVGEDPGENPNMTLIVSKKADPGIVERISAILLALKDDDSPEAEAVKEKLGITGFIKTTVNDFRFTLPLLKRAGVDASFDFSF